MKFFIVFLVTTFLSLNANSSEKIILSDKTWEEEIKAKMDEGINLNQFWVEALDYNNKIKTIPLLHKFAWRKAKQELALQLYQKGYDFKQKNDNGVSILFFDCVSILAEYPEVRFEIIKDLIDSGALNEHPANVLNCLNEDSVFDYIIKHKIIFDINQRKFGSPLSLWLIRQLSPKDFDKLMYLNPDFSLRADFGASVIQKFVGFEKEDREGKIKYLVRKGANINARDNRSYTPLIVAILRGHLALVKPLVEAGAIIRLKTLQETESVISGMTAINVLEARIKRKLSKSEQVEDELHIYRYLIEQGDFQRL